ISYEACLQPEASLYVAALVATRHRSWSFEIRPWPKLPPATLPIDAGVSDAAALARPAAVVRDWRHVTNCRDLKPDALQRTERGLAPRAGPGNLDLEDFHAVLDRLLAGVLGRDLGRVRRRLARAFEPHRPSRGPSDRVTLD